jgi:gamma-glutamylcysteine synthetase
MWQEDRGSRGNHPRELASVYTQVGIFYDKEVQAEAAALVADWTLADMEYMREQVGLDQKFRV